MDAMALKGPTGLWCELAHIFGMILCFTMRQLQRVMSDFNFRRGDDEGRGTQLLLLVSILFFIVFISFFFVWLTVAQSVDNDKQTNETWGPCYLFVIRFKVLFHWRVICTNSFFHFFVNFDRSSEYSYYCGHTEKWIVSLDWYQMHLRPALKMTTTSQIVWVLVTLSSYSWRLLFWSERGNTSVTQSRAGRRIISPRRTPLTRATIAGSRTPTICRGEVNCRHLTTGMGKSDQSHPTTTPFAMLNVR